MISHYMQGGDVCENAPNLRLDTNNMEIGALTAPRPMLMVSAAGDWTRDTPRIEFPAVQSVYALLGAKDEVATVQFIADHNYNRDSREAVYALVRAGGSSGRTDAAPFKEAEYHAEQPADLLVFFGRELPKEAKTQPQIVEALIEARKAQLAALRPRDAAGLARFREVLGPALRHALAAESPGADAVLESPSIVRRDGGRARPRPRPARPGRPGPGPALGGAAGAPEGRAHRPPGGIAGASAHEASLVEPLRRQGSLVASIDAFNTGSARASRDTSDRFFTTYNRTDDANRVQDVLTAARLAEAAAGHPRGVPRRPRAGRALVPARPGARARPRRRRRRRRRASRRSATRPISTGSPSLFSAAWAASRRP